MIKHIMLWIIKEKYSDNLSEIKSEIKERLEEDVWIMGLWNNTERKVSHN